MIFTFEIFVFAHEHACATAKCIESQTDYVNENSRAKSEVNVQKKNV